VEGPGAVSNQLPDRLLVVPERGGLITGWRCNGVEWLYLDVQRFADPSKLVRGGIPVLFPICGGLPGDQLPLPSSDDGSGVDLLAGPVSAVSLVDPPRAMVCLEPWTAPRQALIRCDRRLELAPGASSTLECRYRMSGGPSTQASG
jgi:galactose mutarotase-like enzyme